MPRRFQFSIRTLFSLTLVTAILLALVIAVFKELSREVQKSPSIIKGNEWRK